MYEGTNTDLAYRYVLLTKSALLAVLYSPIQPLGPLLSILMLILIYWTDKFIFIRRDSYPKPINELIAIPIITIILLLGPLYATSSILFNYLYLFNREYDKPY